MAEDNAVTTEAPTETAAPAGDANGVGTSPSTPGLSPREAAIAALGDMGEPDPSETGEEGGEPVVGAKEAEKPPEPVKEQLSPQLRAIAAQEKRNRELADGAKADREAAQAERAAFLAEKQAWEQERAKPVASLDKYKGDLVAFADDHNLSPAERQQLATDLWHSTQPAEKRPPTYRKQGAVLTEVEALKRNYESLAKKLQEKEEAETKAQEAAREEQETAELARNLLTEAKATETAPFVTSFMEVNPRACQSDLKLVARRMIEQAEDPSSITSEKVVMEYERLLAKQAAWVLKAQQASKPAAKDGTSAPPKGQPAAKALTNQGTASPTRGQAPMTAEDRRAAALAALED